MKLTYFSKTPNDVYLAFSGGIDSVVLLHNLLKRKIKVTLVHVHHNTPWCDKEQTFALETAAKNKIEIKLFKIPKYDKSTSLECFWSKHRNDFFLSLDKPVLTGHNLDDAIEWYLMSTLQGTVKLLNYQNRNILRPMLGIRKTDIVKYVEHFKLDYLTDPTNNSLEFNLRNKVRHALIPNVEMIFPGIAKTVLRLIREKETRILKENKV